MYASFIGGEIGRAGGFELPHPQFENGGGGEEDGEAEPCHNIIIGIIIIIVM